MFRTRATFVTACIALLITLNLAAGPAAIPARGSHSSPTGFGHSGNPHLHAPVHESHDEHHDRDHDHDHRHWHSHWYRGWNYWAYISLHRGYGNIVGKVQNASGPMQVNLRHSNGRMFHYASKKHIVFTAASGNFLMTGVRAGSYRIVAHTPGGKRTVHAQVGVHTGHTSSVAIRW